MKPSNLNLMDNSILFFILIFFFYNLYVKKFIEPGQFSSDNTLSEALKLNMIHTCCIPKMSTQSTNQNKHKVSQVIWYGSLWN